MGFTDVLRRSLAQRVSALLDSEPWLAETGDWLLRSPHKAILLFFWALLICSVVLGSLAPGNSPIMAAVGRIQLGDKALHFCAYLALSALPTVGFRNRRHGVLAGGLMFVLSLLLEAGQHFFPGRTVELGDLIANAAGVSCGIVLALPIRSWTASL